MFRYCVNKLFYINIAPMEQSILQESEVKKKPAWKDFLEALIIALAIALPIKFFVASPFIVVGASMYPTFENSDYLIVDKLIYQFEEPRRGDVVVFRPPTSEKTYFIKRIIGLPGETVRVRGNIVTIINKTNPNGFVLSEDYVSSEREGIADTTLESGQYFVMGDNRAVSSDSRVWGPLTKERISGRVDLRLFPLSEIDIMPGKVESKL